VDLDQETLTVRLPDALGGLRVIPGVRFPYGQEILQQALKKQIAISYRFVRKKKGWYILASTQAPRGERRTDRARGVLGVDLGPGGMAAVETDRIGNPIARKTYPLALYHKTRFQARALIGDVAAEIGDWAKRCGKPLALENLEFEEKKALLRERGKGRVEGWCGNLSVPFPPPARSNVAGGFPALRFPACFLPRVMGPIEWKPLSSVDVLESGTPRRGPVLRKATVDSTVSTQSLAAAEHASDDVASSFRPVLG
jgi:hypothetical protein